MAVRDISLATEALQNLLTLNVPRLSGGPVTVNTLRPERVAGASSALNLYCYHVSEDPHNKLRPRQTGGQAIATSPLSLVLHYIVTAHIGTGGTFDALAEQRLLSYAMKTFHDIPVIEDGVFIGTDAVLPLDLQGMDNRFEISLTQMGPMESLEYWGTDDQGTPRPSAYYEVRPVEIAPEPPTRVPGIVLTLGNFVFPLGTPQIAATEGSLAYALPASLGGDNVLSTVSPAKTGPINPVAPPDWNQLRLRGAALDKGQNQMLLLSHPLWALMFPDLPRVPVDMVQNAALGWSQTLADGEARITVGEALDIARPDGSFARVEMYPGTYMLSWSVELVFEQPGGPRVIQERSNEAAFSINPRITGFVRNGGTGAVTLDVGGTWSLDRGTPPPADPAIEPELDILLSVDGDGYTRWEAQNPGDPQPIGTFSITAHQLVYVPVADANAVGLHTVRLIVNGADAQPFWIEIP
ncbi:MAG: DUF4255 domain-containing protein [Roseobacter sp.]